MEPYITHKDLHNVTEEIRKRLKALEKDSHPPVDFGQLFDDVNKRLDALEKAILRLEG